MSVLLDEMVPTTLVRHLVGAETVRDRGWSGLRNSDLLTAPEAAGFSVLVTADRSLRYQQDISARKIGVVVLRTSKLNELIAELPAVVAAISKVRPGDVIEL